MNLPAIGPHQNYLLVSESISAWGLLRLREQLETGLPLTPRPYQTLAERVGLTEHTGDECDYASGSNRA